MVNAKVPRKVDVKRLRDPDVQKEFEQASSILEGVWGWETVRDSLYNIGKEVLGFVGKKHQDWFDENDTEICQLLSEKNVMQNLCCVWRIFRLRPNAIVSV